jgi:uncharacterized protein YrzB (UPF0473 family)
MQDSFETDIVTLVDDEGNGHEFEILDILDENDRTFYALLPTSEDESEGLEQDTYYIFEAFETEDGEQELAEVSDEELLDQLADIFEKRFDELYEEVSDEETNLQ